MAVVPTGFHWTPTPRQLIDPYLIQISESQGKLSPLWTFVSKNVYGQNSAPWQILSDSDPWFPVGDKESATKKVIYVYTQIIYASKNRKKNLKRRAGSGRWSAENKGNEILQNEGGIMKLIGNDKLLTYKPDGITTKAGMDAFNARYGHWTMHEYTLAGMYGPSDFVICEITKDEKMTMSQIILPPHPLQLDGRQHDSENAKKKAKVVLTDNYPVQTATLVPQQYSFIPANHDHQASTSTSTAVFSPVVPDCLFSIEEFQNNYSNGFIQNNMLPPLERVTDVDAKECCYDETLHGTRQNNQQMDLLMATSTEDDSSIELSTEDEASLAEWINEILQSDQ